MSALAPATAHTPNYYWAIREDLAKQISMKQSASGQNPVEMAPLERMLQRARIPHAVVPCEAWEKMAHSTDKIKPAPTVTFDEKAAFKTIYENEMAKVEWVVENGRRHLLGSPKEPIPFEAGAMVEQNRERFVAVQRTAYRVASAFGKVFDSSAYAQSIIEREGTFSIELFPAGSEKGKVILNRKDERSVYWLTKGQFGSYEWPAAPQGALENAIIDSCERREEIIPPMSNEFAVTNCGEAAAFRARTMLEIWSSQGLPVEPMAVNESYSPPELPIQVKKLGSCAFCKAEVIKNDSLAAKTEMHTILFNAFPYFAQQIWDLEKQKWEPNPEARHVLVVLNQHGMAKSDAQIFEEMKIIARMQTCYKTMYPGTAPTNLKQLGTESGQTVPHDHSHVVARSLLDAADYMYHLSKEDHVVGDRSEWPKSYPQPSDVLVAIYNKVQPENC